MTWCLKTLATTALLKLLRVEEAERQGNKFVLRTAEKEDIRRVSVVLDTTLPYQNNVNAINIFVLPVLTFFIPVLYFSHKDLSDVDLKIKRLLKQTEVRHSQRLNTLLYASRSVGGRGLKEVTNIDLQRNQEQVSFKSHHI